MNEITLKSKRLERERITLVKMIEMFCRVNHNMKINLCDECNALQAYALERLLMCPFDENKPVCSNCTVHCYKPEMRQRVKDVMRFSGPRMIFKHPYLAIMHLIDDKIIKPSELRKNTG